MALRQENKTGSAVRDLGCSINEFREYLSSKFSEGMTWENYGEWHIDHIIPLSKFNLSKRVEFLKAAHFTNLQPLWEQANLAKSNR
jgi:5-methylcytosine-specific restriction endonuclease McrA